jgi:hypothetical protein
LFGGIIGEKLKIKSQKKVGEAVSPLLTLKILSQVLILFWKIKSYGVFRRPKAHVSLQLAQVELKRALIFFDFARLFSKKLKNEEVFTDFYGFWVKLCAHFVDPSTIS